MTIFISISSFFLIMKISFFVCIVRLLGIASNNTQLSTFSVNMSLEKFQVMLSQSGSYSRFTS